MSRAELQCGVRIEGHSETYSEPAYISVSILGTGARIFLTPIEVRLLAIKLTHAADSLEVKT